VPKTYSLKDVLYKTTSSSIKETFIILCHTAVFMTIYKYLVFNFTYLKNEYKGLASPLLHYVKYLKRKMLMFSFSERVKSP